VLGPTPEKETDAVPTYQYACTSCGTALEAQQSFSDDPLTVCPECEGRLRKVFSAVGVVFKGSGFYRNDSRPSPSDGDKSASTSSDSSGSSGSGSSDSGSSKSTSDSGSSKSTGDSGGSSAKPAAKAASPA
jgi:putative FmdB family regulatory protein